jgi:hypothetical protein
MAVQKIFDMKKLEKTFESKGFNFKQLLRDGNMAIYEKIHNGSKVPNYELIYITSHNGYEIQGNKIAPSEIYPGDKAWGTHGWTYTSFDDAKASLKKKIALIDKNETKRPTKRTRKKRNTKSEDNGVVLTCPITNLSRKAPVTYLLTKAQKYNVEIGVIVENYASREGLKRLRNGSANHSNKEMLLKYNGKGD